MSRLPSIPASDAAKRRGEGCRRVRGAAKGPLAQIRSRSPPGSTGADVSRAVRPDFAEGVAACCHPLKIAARISCSAFPSRSRQSGKTDEAFLPAGADPCRAAFRRGGCRLLLIRISTDIEINGNEQPEAISVAGKDIRCPSQVTPPASFVASCVGGTVTFRSELSASPRPARSGSPARRWLTVDRNPNAWKACSDG